MSCRMVLQEIHLLYKGPKKFIEKQDKHSKKETISFLPYRNYGA